jgi:hypothetical protein
LRDGRQGCFRKINYFTDLMLIRIFAWVPLLLLPIAALVLTPAEAPRWVLMWGISFALFTGCKWLTWLTAKNTRASWGRHLGYLVAWPGLDAPTFLNSSAAAPPLSCWLLAAAKLLLGILLIWVVFPALPTDVEFLRGWVGMIGIVFVLHFGVFHLLSLFWQSLGVQAKPLMNWPILAHSVSDFWGQRWNTAFRDLTHRFLFRPLTGMLGGPTAILVGFFFSGVIHDLVISVPAEGGYGGPAAFFLIQAVALLLERSEFGRRLGLGQGWRGWAFTLLVLLVPSGLLFHRPFLTVVIVPFVDWLVHPGRLW